MSSDYPFIFDLSESHLIPSRNSLKDWKRTKLAELCYLYFISLVILLANDETKQWARSYCKETGNPNDFKSWRTNGNDLYVMLYALGSEDAKGDKINIVASTIRNWLRHMADHEDDQVTHGFLMRIDSMFHISNSSMKSIRRTVTDWDDTDATERHDVIVKLVQLIHDRAPSNSELLPKLKKLSSVHESASAGATGAASVATVVGGLGAGFDPDGDHGVYEKKPVVIRREQTEE